jgi:apolipoprotein N-acyltransferase
MTLHAEPAASPAGAASPHASSPDTPARRPPLERGLVKLALLILSAVLTSLAFAPFGQFYLAWIGLVPLLLVIRDARSSGTAFLWGWLGGSIFFYLNFVYLLLVTVPGALALPPYLALYWGLAAAILRGTGVLRVDPAGPSPLATLLKPFAAAAVWVAAEYLRGIVFTGLPWLFIGYTQSPLLALCQIADVTGVYGVMFLVVLLNVLLLLTLTATAPRRRLIVAWTAAAALIAATCGYGLFRLGQRDVLTPGPTVLVVQPNDRDFRNKGALDKQRQSVQFHMEQTTAALAKHPADLIVWSETTMPALNPEVRAVTRGTPVGELSERTDRGIAALARLHDVPLLVGGYDVEYQTVGGKRVPVAMRNSAFFYARDGAQAARYDKIHLVPFGEFIPGKQSWPWFYRLFLWLSPYTAEYSVTGGSEDALTVFPLNTAAGQRARFVSPICFDDIDPALIARMFRGADGATRADFIVNLTNDGWFRWNEQPQHLQHALFRSIENRAPTARAVNTGVSGFIDSCGRVAGALGVGAVGTLTRQITLDRRVSFYTRHGDVFAYACVIASMLVLAWTLIWNISKRRAVRP